MPQTGIKRARATTRQAPSERFFEKQLAGEEAPSFATMENLFIRAAQIYARAPWEQMSEDDLVAFQDPASGQTCYASVMGEFGTIMAIQILIGELGHSWFRNIKDLEFDPSPDDFMAENHSVFVRFVSSAELGPLDRRLARSMGQHLSRRMFAPEFRAVRPGYHPWYVTEPEALLLTRGLEAVLAMCEVCADKPEVDFWNQDDVYPLVHINSTSFDSINCTVGQAKAPPRLTRMPVLPKLDCARIETILRRHWPQQSSLLQIDHFNGPGAIGKANERKACMRIALAIDGETAFAYPPVVGSPDDSIGEMLQSVVLQAIETSRAVPTEIHVRNREFKTLLEPLAQALSIPVKTKPSLPALEFARDAMNKFFG